MATDTQHHYLASSILPSAVQNRLPVLTHLRKSISWTAILEVPVNPLRRSRSQKSSQASTPTSTAPSSPPSTPPSGLMAYSSGSSGSRSGNRVLLPAASVQAIEQELAQEQLRQQNGLPALPPRHGSVVPLMTPLAHMPQPQQNDTSGIKWQYAQQGSMLHSMGTQSSNDVAFIRKSYIDGVSYLLRGLPEDLSQHEAAVIEQSLPARCLESLGVDGAQNGDAALQQHNPDGWTSVHGLRQEPEPLFRRTVRKAAMQFILWMYLLFKLIMMLLRLGAHYEKRYNISQQVMSRGLGFAGALGRQGLLVGDSIAQMGEGRMAGAITAVGVWVAEQVTSGIREGLSEGIEAINEGHLQTVSSLRRSP